MPLSQVPSAGGGTTYTFNSPLSESGGTVSLTGSNIRATADVSNIVSKELIVFDSQTAVSTGDGKLYFQIPSYWNNASITRVVARVLTAGTTGTTDIQIHNVNQAWDVLSTKITIDSGETSSLTAVTAPVINGSNDVVLQDELIRIDVDAVSTTAPVGLQILIEATLSI